MTYSSETQKIRPRLERFCQGLVLDVGCGNDLIVPGAKGIDGRALPTVWRVTQAIEALDLDLPDLVGKCDAVFSSHCLEHLRDDHGALVSWARMLRPGGYLCLYLPDDQKYDNSKNPEHIQAYTRVSFLEKFQDLPLALIESGDDHGDDRYSFWVVYQLPEQ